MDTACQDGASFQKKNDKMLKARALYLPARGNRIKNTYQIDPLKYKG